MSAPSSIRSHDLFRRAQTVTPGGVNSPVRAFRAVGGEPKFIASGDGAYMTDADGNRYIDYVGSWGPLILGHNSVRIREALLGAIERGTSFGAPTEGEVLFAEELISILPGVEMIRFVSSGTEATMSALRLARGWTKRDVILKFDGCYHGHADSLLVQAGSGVATLGIPGSPGVPAAVAELSISVPFNDLSAVEQAVEKAGPGRIAAIIVEPVPGNMGLVLPELGFLEGLRSLCSREGIVLIFDEVMTGFRVALGGAAERFNITPDLSTYGKIIGGGLPVGAFGGRAEIMSALAPNGSIYQAGTLSGNPLAMAAGRAAINELIKLNPYSELEAKGRRLITGLKRVCQEFEIPLTGEAIGGMVGFFFSEIPVKSFADARRSDVALFNKFFHAMLERGVYLAPSPYETCFVSTMHTNEIIDQTVETAKDSLTACFR